MIENDVIGALDLGNTYYRDAPAELGVIPAGLESGWNYSLGEANAYVINTYTYIHTYRHVDKMLI